MVYLLCLSFVLSIIEYHHGPRFRCHGLEAKKERESPAKPWDVTGGKTMGGFTQMNITAKVWQDANEEFSLT